MEPRNDPIQSDIATRLDKALSEAGELIKKAANLELGLHERDTLHREAMHKLIVFDEDVTKLNQCPENSLRARNFYWMKGKIFHFFQFKDPLRSLIQAEEMYRSAIRIVQSAQLPPKEESEKEKWLTEKLKLLVVIQSEMIELTEKDIKAREKINPKSKEMWKNIGVCYSQLVNFYHIHWYVKGQKKEDIKLLDKALLYIAKAINVFTDKVISDKIGKEFALHLIELKERKKELETYRGDKEWSSKSMTFRGKITVLDHEIQESKLVSTQLIEAAKEENPEKIENLLKKKMDQSVFVNAAINAALHNCDVNLDLLMTKLDKEFFIQELKKTIPEEKDKLNAIKKILIHFDLQKAFPIVKERSAAVVLFLSFNPDFQKDRIIFKRSDESVVTIPVSRLRKNVAASLAKEAEINATVLWKLLANNSIEEEKRIAEEKQAEIRREQQVELAKKVASLKDRLAKDSLDEKVKLLQAECKTLNANLQSTVVIENQITLLKHSSSLFSGKKGRKCLDSFTKKQILLRQLEKQLATEQEKLNALPKHTDLLCSLDQVNNIVAFESILQQEKLHREACDEITRKLHSFRNELMDAHEKLKSWHGLCARGSSAASHVGVLKGKDSMLSSRNAHLVEENKSEFTELSGEISKLCDDVWELANSAIKSELKKEPCEQDLPKVTSLMSIALACRQQLSKKKNLGEKDFDLMRDKLGRTKAQLISKLDSSDLLNSEPQSLPSNISQQLAELKSESIENFSDLEAAIRQQLSDIFDEPTSKFKASVLRVFPQTSLGFFPAAVSAMNPEGDLKFEEKSQAMKPMNSFHKAPGHSTKLFSYDASKVLAVCDQLKIGVDASALQFGMLGKQG